MRGVTLKLILVNLLVFFVFYPVLLSSPESINYIALKPSWFATGRAVWTLLTSMFMHGGFFHLFVNMLSLLFVGSFLERLIGGKRFLLFYLAAGVCGSLFFVASDLLFVHSDLPAVGASGAIFGIGGMLALLTPYLPVYIMFIPIALPMWLGITMMLAALWVISAAAKLPIGNTAHLGGFLAGVAYALYLRFKYPRKARAVRRFFAPRPRRRT